VQLEFGASVCFTHKESDTIGYDARSYDHKIHVRYIKLFKFMYEGWNFNSGNYLFTTDTK